MRLFSIKPQGEIVLAAAITTTTPATAVTLMTLTRSRRLVVFVNSLNEGISLTHNGDYMVSLPAGVSLVLDLASNYFDFDTGVVIGAYRVDAQPTTGFISVMAA